MTSTGPRRTGVLLLIVLLFAAGCGYDGASSLPLPGAVGGPDTYRVTVILDDATNLVAKETCRSNDTVIGSVESVVLDKDLRARVVCRIKNSVRVPANAVATLSETSLLGERFLALDPPRGSAPRGELARGSTLPASRTRSDPNVELVFGALSQVLNGGSLGSIETITRELDKALSGTDLRGGIDQVGSAVSMLNNHRSEITRSLTSLDRLAGRLARQRKVLAEALDAVPGGLAVLERQRARLVRTLRRVASLSGVAVPLIARTRADLVADVRHVAPVLAELNKASDELALTLGRIATFPFPSNGMSALKGDFGGMYATLDLDVDFLNGLLGGARTGAGTAAPRGTAASPGGTTSAPPVPVPAPGTGTFPPGPAPVPVLPTRPGGLVGLLIGLLGGRG